MEIVSERERWIEEGESERKRYGESVIEREIEREKEMRGTEKVSARFDGERERARNKKKAGDRESDREIQSDEDS